MLSKNRERLDGQVGRLLIGPDGPGAMQMELDRRMADASASDGLVRVRFYHFIPPSVSLGHHQDATEIDEVACAERGFDLVRRPTGGRAVLHKGDLVYSISVRIEPDADGSDGPFHKGIYNQVSLALIDGFARVGVRAGGVEENSPIGGKPLGDLPRLCFSSATRHEVQVDGRKLVGSAQRRFREVVLQHGSILLNDDHLQLAELIAGRTAEQKTRLKQALRSRTMSLREAGFEEEPALVDAMTASFTAVFGPLQRWEGGVEAFVC